MILAPDLHGNHNNRFEHAITPGNMQLSPKREDSKGKKYKMQRYQIAA
jgi:hypothetical protein